MKKKKKKKNAKRRLLVRWCCVFFGEAQRGFEIFLSFRIRVGEKTGRHRRDEREISKRCKDHPKTRQESAHNTTTLKHKNSGYRYANTHTPNVLR